MSTTSESASPRLPLELSAQVIENVAGILDLLRCSLVCRAWLACVRARIRFSALQGFYNSHWLKTLLACPQTTLLHTLRHLTMTTHGGSNALSVLGKFTNLQSLSLVRMSDDSQSIRDLPDLPSLKHLEFSGVRFHSSATFVAMMSRLPYLESLKLERLLWEVNENTSRFEASHPPLRLAFLELDVLNDYSLADERAIFSLRPIKLKLSFGHCTPASTLTVSRYLIHLGSEIHSLEHHCPFETYVDHSLVLDLSTNSNLTCLVVHSAINFGDNNFIWVHSALVKLLSTLPTNTHLQHVVLHAWNWRTIGNWVPLSRLAQLLAIFTSLRTVEVNRRKVFGVGSGGSGPFEDILRAQMFGIPVLYVYADE